VGYVDREDILSMVRSSNYGPACQKHFEVTHPKAEAIVNMDGIGNHPNAWFEASRNYYEAKERLMKRWKGGVVEGVVRRMKRPKATRKPSL